MVVHDLISRLGGPMALGAKINAAPKAVSMWSKRGAIPRKYHLAVWRLAISEGIDWAPPGSDGLTLMPAATSAATSAAPEPRAKRPTRGKPKAAPVPDAAPTPAPQPTRGEAA